MLLFMFLCSRVDCGASAVIVIHCVVVNSEFCQNLYILTFAYWSYYCYTRVLFWAVFRYQPKSQFHSCDVFHVIGGHWLKNLFFLEICDFL